MAKEREIKYVNRNFNDFRESLIELAKSYFPNTYNDFDESSPGMMIIEMASYVGDVLSFYQDTQLQETFLTHAKDPKNLFNLAYMMGYAPKVTGVSEVELELTQTITGSDAGFNPKWQDAAYIEADAVVRSTDKYGTDFIIDKPVDFRFSSSYDPTEITIASFDSSGNPSGYTLKKKAKAFSGTIKTSSYSISTSEKFKTLTISDNKIVGILDITGSSGDTYYEVPFLGQDTIFADSTNNNSDSNNVPFVLTLKKAPKRFVSRLQSNGDINVQFGAGTLNSDDSEIIPDPTLVGNGTNQGISRIDYAYDPSNFTFSKSYGISPSENLQVRYITGGGVNANSPANSITNKVSVNVTRGNAATVSVNNLRPAAGGRGGDTVEELRENSLRAFNEQGRAVTLQDYTVRAAALPAKFGSVAKVFATQDQLTNTNTTDAIVDNNPLSISLYVLAYNSDSKLITATSTLKENLKTYLSQYMVLSDSINIKDAFIVNIGVEYEVLIRPSYSSRDVLLNCNEAVKDYFKVSNRSINQIINISEIKLALDKVKGVQTVQKLEIVNKQGGNYSNYAYDIPGATRKEIVYPSFDPCIFEVKYPNSDIKGRVITV